MRSCKECGAAVPWGAPQCVDCGSYTHWRDRLATFGFAVGAGTVIVVIVSLAWVWLAPPPESVQAAGEVQELMNRVDEADLGPFIAGAGRCKPEIADALCVQVTAELDGLGESQLERVRREVTVLWESIAEVSPPRVVFVDPRGELIE